MSALRVVGLRSLAVAALLITSPRAVGAADLLLGMYTAMGVASLDAVSGTPIDHIIPYGIDGLPEARIRAYLDAAASRKLKIIFAVNDAFKESKWYPKIDWCPTQDEGALVACIAKEFGGHEAVGGWYLADEPTNLLGRFKGEKLRTNAAMIRANSVKPIFADEVALPRGMHWDLLGEVADMLMVSAYPVPDRPLSEVYTTVAALRSSQRKPVAAVVQIFDKTNVPFFRTKGVQGRPPLYEEVRAMSYLALLAGADGIVYYSMFQLQKMDGWQERLRRLAGLAAELKEHYPTIGSATRPLGGYGVTSDDGVYHALRTKGGADWIVAVNATSDPKTLRIELSGSGRLPAVKTLSLTALEVRIAAISSLK